MLVLPKRSIIAALNAIEPEPLMDWRRYHRLSTIHAYLRTLAAAAPDIVEVIDIGRSARGRPLLVAKVGRRQTYRKPAIFIEGGVKAFDKR